MSPRPQLERITFNPNVMGGKPCIRGMRVTVGMVVGLLPAGHATDEILKAYPYIGRGRTSNRPCRMRRGGLMKSTFR